MLGSRRVRLGKLAPLEALDVKLLSLMFGFLCPKKVAQCRTVSSRFRQMRAKWSTFVVTSARSLGVLLHLADRASIAEVDCFCPIELNVLRGLRLQRLCVEVDLRDLSDDEEMTALGVQTCYASMIRDLERYPVTELLLDYVKCADAERLCRTHLGLETIEFVIAVVPNNVHPTNITCAFSHVLRLPVLPRLHHLTLRADDEAQLEVQGLAQQVSLRSLEICYRTLCELALPNLRSIRVWMEDEMDIQAALSRLAQCPLLESITLHEAKADRAAEEVKLLPCKYLELSGCDNGDNGDFEFLSMVPGLCELKVDGGFFELTDAKIVNLKSLSQLRSLCITHATSQQLVELKSQLPWLAILN